MKERGKGSFFDEPSVRQLPSTQIMFEALMMRQVSLSANSTGALFGLAAFATFSIHDVFIKQLGSTYSPFQIVFFGHPDRGSLPS